MFIENKIRETAKVKNEQYIAKKIGVTKLHMTLQYVYNRAEPAVPKGDGENGTEVDLSRANESQMHILQQSDKKAKRSTQQDKQQAGKDPSSQLNYEPAPRKKHRQRDSTDVEIKAKNNDESQQQPVNNDRPIKKNRSRKDKQNEM